MRNFNKYLLYFAKSCKQATILFHLIGLLLISSFPSAISQVLSYTCNNNSTYVNGSTFSSNLNRVMGELVNNTPQTGFSTSSHGQSPNKIYGLLQCVGNISQQQCSNCSQQANDSVRQLCRNVAGSKVWLRNCFLRYDNSSFFSQLDTDGAYLVNVLNDISTNDLNNFRSTTSNLLTNLSYMAYDPVNKGFAEGSAAYSSTGMVYGLVQCWGDISTQDCESCLKIASTSLYTCCSANPGAQALLGSCRARYEINNFRNTDAAQTPPTMSKRSSKTIPKILGIVGGVLLALVVSLFAVRRKLKSAILWISVAHPQNEEMHENVTNGSESTLLKQKQILFSLKELIESTDNFSESSKVGGGGFGDVYKGKTREGKEIAVKKLCVRSSQGNAEFMNEVKVLANVRHKNLVKLLGCCAEGSERIIVYEYLPNPSLHGFLFGEQKDPEQKRKFDWQTRYKIIMGIAHGLRYLHEESEPRIIHRDIKASNILIDKTLNSKISDFGLARLFTEDETHIQTRVAGTYGYMAPEYAMLGQLSIKVDVYSFGVLVLEIVSGKKISDIHLPQEMQSLLEWGWRLYKQGRLSNMIDSTISETCRQEEAVRCIHVALLCTQADAGIRPTISNVIQMISNSSNSSGILPNPKKPAFVKTSANSSGILPNPKRPGFVETSESNLGGSTESWTSSVPHASTQSPSGSSINGVTITELEVR